MGRTASADAAAARWTKRRREINRGIGHLVLSVPRN
jgi:hypothetical protein